MLKTLFIDFDGVIRIWPKEDVTRAEQMAGLPSGSLFKAAFAPERLHLAITGKWTDEVWRKQVAEDLRAAYPEADGALAVQEWSKPSGEIDQKVLAFVQRCRQQIPVTLVTNATSRLPYDLEALGLSKAFDHIVNSSDIGFFKPQPEIYQHALDQVGVPAENALFVDDKAENVDAAVQLGLNGHVYTERAPLKLKLTELLSK
ncbi:MAG: HAD-IA family hydrolase [Chloroflexota bacterium]